MVKILGYAVTAILGALLFALILSPFIILNGWVLSWLWLWFLVPLGIPAIGVVHAMGITGVVGFLTKQYTETDGEKDRGEKLAYLVVAPFLALAVGYILHSFM
jgi:hypothetical protein